MQGSTALCSAMLGQQSCHYVSRVELVVSRTSASIALLMMLPLVLMFVVDLTVYSVQTLLRYTWPRWAAVVARYTAPFTDLAVKVKSQNMVRRMLKTWRVPEAPGRHFRFTWLARTDRAEH
ncbi:hypothetical protein FDK38_003872 [Candidozyma auris]|nr:hypothetical protein FDK38_003872 [[Candida] auris]